MPNVANTTHNATQEATLVSKPRNETVLTPEWVGVLYIAAASGSGRALPAVEASDVLARQKLRWPTIAKHFLPD